MRTDLDKNSRKLKLILEKGMIAGQMVLVFINRPGQYYYIISALLNFSVEKRLVIARNLTFCKFSPLLGVPGLYRSVPIPLARA